MNIFVRRLGMYSGCNLLILTLAANFAPKKRTRIMSCRNGHPVTPVTLVTSGEPRSASPGRGRVAV
jgi:hypothetical protein